jgi:CubicO group peptidase (beta-lactamase class C family)
MGIRRPTTVFFCALVGTVAVAVVAAEPPNFYDIVQPYVDQGRFVGANGVVVSRQGILNTPSAGFADFESKKPLAWNTMFWIASTSKPFQATAVMMLVDEGKLNLDDPVSKYLPQFKQLKPMTVRMLLNHTNGLAYTAPGQTMKPTDCCSLAEQVDRFVSLPLMFDPGTRFMYSNAGPDTASRIVEVVSGQSFETFLTERLLNPLGMRDTTYFPNDEQLSRLAPGCMFDQPAGKLVRAPNEVFLTSPYGDRKVRHAPGGGLFTTAPDLALFAQMFLNKGALGGRRYLSEASVAEMTRNQVPEDLRAMVPSMPGPDAPMGYGLGWGIGASGAYFHTGVAMAAIRIDPDRGFGTILLSPQAGDEAGFEIMVRLVEAATRHWDDFH